MIEGVVFGANKRDTGQHLARISRYRDTNELRICDIDAILDDVGAIPDCDAEHAMASHAIRDTPSGESRPMWVLVDNFWRFSCVPTGFSPPGQKST